MSKSLKCSVAFGIMRLGQLTVAVVLLAAFVSLCKVLYTAAVTFQHWNWKGIGLTAALVGGTLAAVAIITVLAMWTEDTVDACKKERKP